MPKHESEFRAEPACGARHPSVRPAATEAHALRVRIRHKIAHLLCSSHRKHRPLALWAADEAEARAAGAPTELGEEEGVVEEPRMPLHVDTAHLVRDRERDRRELEESIELALGELRAAGVRVLLGHRMAPSLLSPLGHEVVERSRERRPLMRRRRLRRLPQLSHREDELRQVFSEKYTGDADFAQLAGSLERSNCCLHARPERQLPCELERRLAQPSSTRRVRVVEPLYKGTQLAATDEIRAAEQPIGGAVLKVLPLEKTHAGEAHPLWPQSTHAAELVQRTPPSEVARAVRASAVTAVMALFGKAEDVVRVRLGEASSTSVCVLEGRRRREQARAPEISQLLGTAARLEEVSRRRRLISRPERRGAC